MKQALAQMKRLDDDFPSTVAHVAEAAGEKVRPELRRTCSTLRARTLLMRWSSSRAAQVT